MATGAQITFLPDEMIEIILGNDCISYQDIVNFSYTCKQFRRSVMENNKLWKIKFYQRWPSLKIIYEEHIQSRPKGLSWFEELKASCSIRGRVMHQLSQMSAKYYKKQELSQCHFLEYDQLFRTDLGAHPFAYFFITDELVTLLNDPQIYDNLTLKYYALKVVRYIKQSYLSEEWPRFLSLPENEQILEKGAVFIAQWIHPEKQVTYLGICKILDDMAKQVMEFLEEKYPSHPIFSELPEKLMEWKIKNINDNQWNLKETRQIMDGLRFVLFEKINLQGNSEMYYSWEHSCIDSVLEYKQGVPITLSLIYESVARRLGVHCETISFPSHFLLRWKEKYLTEDDIDCYYIDVCNGGQFITKKDCPRIAGASRCPVQKFNVQNAANVEEVVSRIAKNLEVAARQYTHLNGRAAKLRSALEFRHMLQPYDTNVIFQIARFYMLHQMDLTDLMKLLNYIQKNINFQDLELTSRVHANRMLKMLRVYQEHMRPEEEIEQKRRTSKVKYAVGQIMRHKTNNYMCVITGWDPICRASPEWMEEMDVRSLDYGANQPFYNTFADDGSSRYTAQENLKTAPLPGPINHYEIGRYFCKYAGTHYVPNEEKAFEYLEDIGLLGK